MKLENTFSVPVTVDETWRVLLDIERVAPCVPGATLTSHEGDTFGGKVKVKVGPIGLTYGGTATFVSLDEAAKVAVIEASGRDTRGGGTAKAVVTCRLVEAGTSTEVLVETDLAITGKPAQFGRGALAEVSGTLIRRFAANLADEITGAGAPAAPDPGAAARESPTAVPAPAGAASGPPAAPPVATPTPTPAASRPGAEPLSLLDVAGSGSVRRLGLVAAGAAVLALTLGLALARRRRS